VLFEFSAGKAFVGRWCPFKFYFKKAIIRTIKAMEKAKIIHYNEKRKLIQKRRER
jgi:hypothetical protein